MKVIMFVVDVDVSVGFFVTTALPVLLKPSGVPERTLGFLLKPSLGFPLSYWVCDFGFQVYC